jgi:Mg/Co/Ni transporter MgtE
VLDRHATIAEARERVARTTFAAETLTDVFVVNSRSRLEGRVPVAELLRHHADEPLLSALRGGPSLRADASFEEVARTMADYNLTAAPVVDGEERVLGVVTVDDVLETMLPSGWRRRFGLLGED